MPLKFMYGLSSNYRLHLSICNDTAPLMEVIVTCVATAMRAWLGVAELDESATHLAHVGAVTLRLAVHVHLCADHNQLNGGKLWKVARRLTLSTMVRVPGVDVELPTPHGSL